MLVLGLVWGLVLGLVLGCNLLPALLLAPKAPAPAARGCVYIPARLPIIHTSQRSMFSVQCNESLGSLLFLKLALHDVLMDVLADDELDLEIEPTILWSRYCFYLHFIISSFQQSSV